MLRPNVLAEIGALIGDPGRASMLDALMDGRSLTARELAGQAGIAPQTASGHLARLLKAGLILMEPRGRHRYHRLASPDVARLLETVAQFASRPGNGPARATVRTGPQDEALRTARTCYDHFAGRLGVGIADVAAHPPFDLECAVRGMMRLDVTGIVGIQDWGDAAS